MCLVKYKTDNTFNILLSDPINKILLYSRLIDNLPVATRYINPETSDTSIEQGYRLGFMAKGKAYINNHLKFLLKYHKYNQ